MNENTEMYAGVKVDTKLPLIESMLHFRSLTKGAQALSYELEKAGIPLHISGLENLSKIEGNVLFASNHWTATSVEEKAGTYNVVTIMHAVGSIVQGVEIAKPGKQIYVALSEAPRHQAVIDETFGTRAWFNAYAAKVKELGKKKFWAYTGANISRKIHLALPYSLQDVIVSPNTGDFGRIRKFVSEVKKMYEKNKGYMLIFPEADASPTMLQAEGGAEFLSRTLEIPIIPIGIYGDENGFHVQFGEAMDIPQSSSKEAREAFNKKMMEKIASMIPERFHGVYAKKSQSESV